MFGIQSFDPKTLNPQRRLLNDDAQGQIRGEFLDLGADLGDPAEWSDTAVNLNVMDMSYQGWVPADIALRIMQGKIAHHQIPRDFHHDAADQAYAYLQQLGR